MMLISLVLQSLTLGHNSGQLSEPSPEQQAETTLPRREGERNPLHTWARHGRNSDSLFREQQAGLTFDSAVLSRVSRGDV